MNTTGSKFCKIACAWPEETKQKTKIETDTDKPRLGLPQFTQVIIPFMQLIPDYMHIIKTIYVAVLDYIYVNVIVATLLNFSVKLTIVKCDIFHIFNNIW